MATPKHELITKINITLSKIAEDNDSSKNLKTILTNLLKQQHSVYRDEPVERLIVDIYDIFIGHRYNCQLMIALENILIKMLNIQIPSSSISHRPELQRHLSIHEAMEAKIQDIRYCLGQSNPSHEVPLYIFTP